MKIRPVIAAVVALLALGATACADYPAYLGGPQHVSNAGQQTAITVANAASLHSAWTWTPVAKSGLSSNLDASPISYNGVIYIGVLNGDFYAVNAATGQTKWRKQLPADTSCYPYGIVSSATVATDPVTKKPVVYVGAADHYLYALDPATGATIWRAVVGGTSTYYNWSSPTVVNGRIYMGVATCNVALKNGVQEFDQHTGQQVARWYIAGTNGNGAPVYTSAAVASDGSVFVTTADDNGGSTQDAESIVKLRGTDLTRLGGWQIPPAERSGNSDFNASPTLFKAGTTPMVGACNKNGYFYALKQAAPSTLAWKAHLGMDQTQEQIIFCGGSAVYDGTSLYVGANQAPNQTAPGSIYKLNPANGQTQWYTGLDNGPVIGSPSLDGAGVLAVPTYNQANSNGAVYLVNKANGTVLKKFSENFTMFAQPVFANNELLIAGANLQAFAP